MQPRHLSTHKIASKSVNNFFTYPAEMQKSGANLVPKSGICSGSGSEVNQLVDAEMQKSGANLVPKSGICSGSGSEVNQLVDSC